jgi:hypothetical protein
VAVLPSILHANALVFIKSRKEGEGEERRERGGRRGEREGERREERGERGRGGRREERGEDGYFTGSAIRLRKGTSSILSTRSSIHVKKLSTSPFGNIAR